VSLLRDFAPGIAGILLGTLMVPFFRNRFPLNLMRNRPGDSHATLFARIIFSAVLFGGMFGLIGGWSIMLATLLFPHVGSK